MNVLFIMILWTWGLTPLWVNIIGTVILSLRLLWYLVSPDDDKEDDDNVDIKW